MKSKLMASMVLGAGLILGAPAVSKAEESFTFTDVKESDEKYVQFLIENEITVGTGEGKYGSGSETTRGEMAKFLGRALGLVDTESGSKAVEEIKKAGVAQGYKDGTFGEDRLITRGEMAIMLNKAFPSLSQGVEGKEDVGFKDVKKGSSHYNSVQVLAKAGVTKGKGEGVFAPEDKVTRKEMAVFLYKVFNGDFPQYEFTLDEDSTNSGELKTLTAGKIPKNLVHSTKHTPQPTLEFSEEGKKAIVSYTADYKDVGQTEIKVGTMFRHELELQDNVAPTIAEDTYAFNGGNYYDFRLTMSEPVELSSETVVVTLYKDGHSLDITAGAEASIQEFNGEHFINLRIYTDTVPDFDTMYIQEVDGFKIKDLAGNLYQYPEDGYLYVGKKN